MKRIAIIPAVLAAVALLAAPSFGAGPLKVGVVDLGKALNSTEDGIKATEALKKKYQPREDQILARQKELQDLADKIKSPVVAKDAKAAMQKDLEKKSEELYALVTRTKAEINRDEQTVSKPIGDALRKIAEKMAKEEGITLLLEKREGGVLMADESIDLTDRVVKAYNANPPPPEKK